MKNVYAFSGIIPPMVTVFDKDGDIDLEANRKLVDWLIDQGIHGILFLGSSGEFSALTLNERKLFAEEMIAHVNGRIPVLIGTGTTNLPDTFELSEHAERAGASGVLVINPYYWKYPDADLSAYYAEIAENVNIPLMIYNFPAVTGQNLSADMICRLASSHENIVGLKDTTEHIGHVREIITTVQQVRADFAVFAAFDDHILPALQFGAAGAINGTSAFAPRLSVELVESFWQHDYERAVDLYRQLAGYMEVYQFHPLFFMVAKEALHQRLFKHQTGVRLPARTFDQGLTDKMKAFLQKHELL